MTTVIMGGTSTGFVGGGGGDGTSVMHDRIHAMAHPTINKSTMKIMNPIMK
jgi:hypothetical protein